MKDEFSLSDIRKVCLEEGITLAGIVAIFKDAMENADYSTKNGDILEDHATRLKAATALCQLLQLPVLGKAAALKEMSGKMPTSLRQLVERRRSLLTTTVEETNISGELAA